MRENGYGTARRVRAHINQIPLGQPFTTTDMLEDGSRTSVDTVLSRMVTKGELTRVTRSVYVRERVNPIVGAVPSSAEDVVQALADARGHTVMIGVGDALNRLGLSTQVPVVSVFLTTGPSRKLQMGAHQVWVRHTAARKLALGNTPAGWALISLWSIGPGAVTDEVIKTVRTNIGDEAFETLCAADKPDWLTRALTGTASSVKAA